MTHNIRQSNHQHLSCRWRIPTVRNSKTAGRKFLTEAREIKLLKIYEKENMEKEPLTTE